MATIPETHRDLLDAPVGVLATIGPKGAPQVTATWFLREGVEGDGDVVKFSLNTVRQKVKNLRQRSECSFLIIDPANPYRTLELRGRAELEDDPDYAFADQVGKKYSADLRSMDQPGQSRVMVTLRPTRVNTWG